MTKAKIIGLCASVAAVATIVVTVIMLGGEEAYRILKIFEVNGTGNVDRADTVISAYEGMKLENNDTLSVGNESTVRLSLDDNKYILLDQNTVMSFEAEGDAKNSHTRIKLHEGAILNEVTEALSSDSIYEVNTPKATMAVRGTSFSAEVIPHKDGYLTKLSVLHGTVSVQLFDESGNPKGDKVSVTEGYAVAVFTEKNPSGKPAEIDGNAYFVMFKDDGHVPVNDGESPLFQLDGSLIPDSIKECALKSDENGLLRLKIAVADELRGEQPQPEQATTTTEATVPEITTTSSTTVATTENTTTTYVSETITTTQMSAETVAPVTTTAEKVVVTTTAVDKTSASSEMTTTTVSETTTTPETTTTTKVTTKAPEISSVTGGYSPVVTTPATTETVTTPEITTTSEIITTSEITTTPETTTTTPAPATYNVNFYDENGDVIYSEEVEENGVVSYIPEVPAKTGYTGEWDYNGEAVTSDMEINAIYTINKYTVTYVADCDNAEDVPDAETYDYGSVVTLPDVPEKTGYTGAWDYDGSEITGDLTITAYYELNIYTVSFSFEGLDNLPQNAGQVQHGDVIELSEIPTFDYYTNSLWICDGIEYDEGESVTVESDMSFVVEYTPVTVQIRIMVPAYDSISSQSVPVDIIEISYGSPFSQNKSNLKAEQCLAKYDNMYGMKSLDGDEYGVKWNSYKVYYSYIAPYNLSDNLIIDDEVVTKQADGTYTANLYIVYTYRTMTVTYLLPNAESTDDSVPAGYEIYATEETTSENRYSVIDVPNNFNGYWATTPDDESMLGSLYVYENMYIYGVPRT